MSDEIVKRNLNPFSDPAGLARLLTSAFEDIAVEDGIESLWYIRSFRARMILEMQPSDISGEVLTDHLGQRFWSGWMWSGEECQAALVRIEERRRIIKWAMDQYDAREKQTHGYVRGLH